LVSLGAACSGLEGVRALDTLATFEKLPRLFDIL